MIRAEGLSYAVGGVPIIRDLSFAAALAAPLLILGPNGAGKSVLLRLLHGLLRPDAGRIEVPGPQAMVFQRPVLLRRSALENVLFPLHGPEAAPRARAALELVGLSAMADRPARRLSGGEQQRLALARAAALAPRILFLDEPCAALDPAATRAVEEIIAHLAAAGTRIVMTSHDLGQARRLAGEVLFLHRGRLLEHTPAADFFTTPRTAEAAAFLRGELLWA
ncbi:ATP-binding cassette domain-containing protein [Rhodovarius crocodyli]|uniref:ATP-binding cassette domain-containing protein n=1 Tax=Rhodovarius crocodyli TaxID=1979269 RepID=A0A437MJE7_9PROT|nr:ATP-binding cassette domain-containing protein [Rhodovarius crocodyli]RVT97736.1 ATP-binding cassette domain-containing protein [Rhodovarius crocodyli]